MEAEKRNAEQNAEVSRNSVSDADLDEPALLPEYAEMYEENHDLIGWLSIEGTVIDYPVMQTMEDEEYYIHRDF